MFITQSVLTGPTYIVAKNTKCQTNCHYGDFALVFQSLEFVLTLQLRVKQLDTVSTLHNQFRENTSENLN